VKIVWHCADRIGVEMAGPGIRVVELSRRLAARHEVTVVAAGVTTLTGEPFRAVEYTPAALRQAVQEADALVTQGFGFPLATALRLRGRLVLDLYDPVQLEQLAQFGPRPTAGQRLSLGYVRARLRALLTRADHVLCASPVQRAFWLGWLGAAGRLGPAALADDPDARKLLAVVPFGLPESPPQPGDARLRRTFSIPASAPVALFWGGLWDWMDPALAVKAVDVLRDQGRELHLVFLGGARPGGDTMRAAATEARETVRALRLEDRVHFLDRWVPYAERGALLLEADLAVTAHRPSLEAELAFRTRLLDCLWARLPVACTRGDTLAIDAEREGWGAAAEPGDVAGLARAMAALLDPATRERARAAAGSAAERYRWSSSAQMILRLLEAPAPPRPPPLVPGEIAGESPLAVARAFAEKAIRRATRRHR
jgi:glycosyltransferase involved in cell wall biosynthesis